MHWIGQVMAVKRLLYQDQMINISISPSELVFVSICYYLFLMICFLSLRINVNLRVDKITCVYMYNAIIVWLTEISKYTIGSVCIKDVTSVCNVKIRVIGNCSATDFSFFSADAVLGVITYIIAIIMSVFFALFYFSTTWNYTILTFTRVYFNKSVL